MLNIKDSYATVFNVEVKEKFVTANISTGEKITDQNGNVSYKNYNWKAMFLGKAKNQAAKLTDKDRIKFNGVAIINAYEKNGVKHYPTLIKIFDFEHLVHGSEGRSAVTSRDDAEPALSIGSEDLPF